MSIKDLRIKLGLSQQGLSDLLEIPRKTITNWEQGVNSPPLWAEKLIKEKLERLIEENGNGKTDAATK